MSREWEDRCLVSRCRVAALRAIVDLGGQPSTPQLKRAIEPVLGDRVPLPWLEDPDDLEAIASSLRAAGEMAASRRSCSRSAGGPARARR